MMPDTGTATTVATVDVVDRASANHASGRVYDPGEPHRGGLPAWTAATAPRHLLTRRELAAFGLRPGRQPVCGQLIWTAPDAITRCTDLFDITEARLTRNPIRRLRGEKPPT
jgi:hypothetical protein